MGNNKGEGSSKRDGKPKCLWEGNDVLCERYIELIVDAINKGGRVESTLKKDIWPKLAEQLSKEFNNPAIERKLVRNRWNELKKRYAIWKAMRGITDHAYDPATGLFDFPPHMWEEIIKKHGSKAKEFKTRPLAHADSMAYMFDATECSGNHNWSPKDDGDAPMTEFPNIPGPPDNSETEDETEDIADLEVSQDDLVLDTYWQGIHINIGNQHGTTSSSQTETPSSTPSVSNTSNRKRKGLVYTSMKTMLGVVQAAFDYFQSEAEIRRAERQADRAQAEKEREEFRAERVAAKLEEEAYSINVVISEMMKLQGQGLVTMGLLTKVFPKVYDKLEFRKAFLTLLNDQEKIFFLKMMGGEV